MKLNKELKKTVKLDWLILRIFFRIIIFLLFVALGIHLMNYSSWVGFISGILCLLAAVTVWFPSVFRIIEKINSKIERKNK